MIEISERVRQETGIGDKLPPAEDVIGALPADDEPISLKD
jgi:hypothetical protein